jgi:hypothetical protein
LRGTLQLIFSPLPLMADEVDVTMGVAVACVVDSNTAAAGALPVQLVILT